MPIFQKSELEKSADVVAQKLKETEQRLQSHESKLKDIADSLEAQKEESKALTAQQQRDREILRNQQLELQRLQNEAKLDKRLRERRAKFDKCNELAAEQHKLLEELYGELKEELDSVEIHSNYPIRSQYRGFTRDRIPKDVALFDAMNFTKNNLLFFQHNLGSKRVSLWTVERGSDGNFIRELLK